MCSLLSCPNNLLSTPSSGPINLYSFLILSDQVSHPYKTTCKIAVPCIVILTLLEERKTEYSKLIGRKNFPNFIYSYHFREFNLDLLQSSPGVSLISIQD